MVIKYFISRNTWCLTIKINPAYLETCKTNQAQNGLYYKIKNINIIRYLLIKMSHSIIDRPFNRQIYKNHAAFKWKHPKNFQLLEK